MKKISMLLSMMVFTLALGAAFATSSSKMVMTEVWRKPDGGGACAPTECVIQGDENCSVENYLYFDNEDCFGIPLAPKRP